FRDFKEVVPITTYEDYADILLKKDDAYLPSPASLWIETTWEGGNRPIKVAPYNRAMLETFFTNVCACFLIATGKKRYDFDIKSSYHMLYGLAPLPYATGLLPISLENQIGIKFLPDVATATSLSFSERNKLGFKQGLMEGIEYFFGLGSVTYYISKSLDKMSGSGGKSLDYRKLLKNPQRALRLMKGIKRAKKENRGLMPKDLFDLKGFVVAGTDNELYKDDLEKMWGVRPLEIFAGTEPTLLGTETYSRKGLVFFPDSCYLEFIMEDEALRYRDDPNHKYTTYTLDEVVENCNYELVISVLKGGAFMRYRVGDIYRCVALQDKEDNINLPIFKYIDRTRDVIDIAGFTRITKNSIDDVIHLSKLDIVDYIACKEIDENNRPYLHMYVEMSDEAMYSDAITSEVLKDHLTAYFKYFDSDYADLKKILGIDPLQITIMRRKAISSYPEKIDRINPSKADMIRFLRHVKESAGNK
ncbi:MAG: GH3 auxin-responsive promoter family protein, partial [Erysipelotrichaceae bacterium]|nr:GH3 auxin-responsive promoter family protein [Erysipelotrichaceae bacterium]